VIAAMVRGIESGGEAGLSTAAGGDIVTVWACISIALRMDSVGAGLHLIAWLDRTLAASVAGSRSDGSDLGWDVVRWRPPRRGLAGEALSLLRDHGEAAAGIRRRGPPRWCVEREHKWSGRNLADQAEDRSIRLDMGVSAPG